MAYTPNKWEPQDIITSEKLNNIEQGIANVELTPGPQGEQGPKGDKGDQGPTGPAGFGTEEQYNAIIARLDASEGGTA